MSVACFCCSEMAKTNQLLQLCCVVLIFQSMSEERYRPLTSRLLVGRPRWKLLFDEIGRTNKQWVEWECPGMEYDSSVITFVKSFLSHCGFSKRVGVFCCGPKGISRTLHRLCNSARYSGTTFEFNKESFSWSNIRAGSKVWGQPHSNFAIWYIWNVPKELEYSQTIIIISCASPPMLTKGPAGQDHNMQMRPVSLSRPAWPPTDGSKSFNILPSQHLWNWRDQPTARIFVLWCSEFLKLLFVFIFYLTHPYCEVKSFLMLVAIVRKKICLHSLQFNDHKHSKIMILHKKEFIFQWIRAETSHLRNCYPTVYNHELGPHGQINCCNQELV